MTCRRCTECVGEEHHRMEPEAYSPIGGDDDIEEFITVWKCKHCDWIEAKRADVDEDEEMA